MVKCIYPERGNDRGISCSVQERKHDVHGDWEFGKEGISILVGRSL